MTDPLGILADHLQGLADQVAAALQLRRQCRLNATNLSIFSRSDITPTSATT
ncbi:MULTISPECIES: hypothetical protein [Mesorhizobium]|jgi:hypothetical protein|uniref:hypothetical protein n=1 Tax=Mesorhizobium TaxID=68287 RepID=UPI0013E29D1E|nr:MULTISPECIES: hypothetical protein [Mesorhizobium]MCF6125468.1 hypothetical protein [Mesorhizobium ciceri]MCQ8814507.1 hypothetical protein [Mesorhizobium sp. SEMIA396]